MEDMYPDIHPGLLPFVPLDKIFNVLQQTAITGSPVRKAKIYMSIFRDLKPVPDKPVAKFEMRLNGHKVYRRFGPRPESGRIINEIEGRPVVTIAPQLAMFPHKFEVICAAKYRQAVEMWLIDNCR